MVEGNEISTVETCGFIKANGERCRASRLHGSEFCFFHSPEVVLQRAEARRAGGLNRCGPKGETGSYLIKSPADVLTILEDAINDACALPSTGGRARSVGYLCAIILKGFEIVDMDARLKALEDKVFRGK